MAGFLGVSWKAGMGAISCVFIVGLERPSLSLAWLSIGTSTIVFAFHAPRVADFFLPLFLNGGDTVVVCTVLLSVVSFHLNNC